MKFEYEKEDMNMGCAPCEDKEPEPPQFPKVYIRVPREALKGLTMGGKVSITIQGEICALEMNDYRNEVTVYAESGEVKNLGEQNAFSKMAEDEDPE